MTGRGFQIVVIRPSGFVYGESWREAVDALHFGLQSLGITVLIRENHLEDGAIPIIFGAHHLTPESAARLPGNTIIYNFEQLKPGYPWYQESYLNLLKRHQVWDYSRDNFAAMPVHEFTAGRRHVPVGYVPQWTNIVPGKEDVDVLFYGLLSPRRQAVLDKFVARGLKVIILRGVFGSERNSWIARAKVVLNLHLQDGGMFESLRVLYLMANSKAVVTETARSGDIDVRLSTGIRAVPYGELVEACEALVMAPLERASLGAAALRAITNPELSMARILRDIPEVKACLA